METKEILEKIAYLEFANDQLQSELDDIDQLLRRAGFPEGIESVRDVALELLEEGYTDALDYQFAEDFDEEFEEREDDDELAL